MVFKKHKYSGILVTKFRWLIPFIVGVSKSTINDKTAVYAIHLTPFFEVGCNWKGTKKVLRKKY